MPEPAEPAVVRVHALGGGRNGRNRCGPHRILGVGEEAMMRHDLYSLYKSGADEEIRAKARQEYIDAIGLSDSFRWNQSQDVNVTHSDAVIF